MVIELAVLQQAHSIWAANTFGERPFTVDLQKMMSEAKEAMESGEPEEFADILLCLLSACDLRGIRTEDLLNLAFAKLEKNRQRRWAQNPDGTWSHVKGSVS
jgi:hypothetical protein